MPEYTFSIFKADTSTKVSTYNNNKEYYTTKNVTTSAEDYIERFITKACLSAMPLSTLINTVTAFEAVAA